jgi:hypothetical protein
MANAIMQLIFVLHLCSHSVLHQDRTNASSTVLIATGTPLPIVHCNTLLERLLLIGSTWPYYPEIKLETLH